MKHHIARAGLFMGLALVCSARGEEPAKPPGPVRRHFEWRKDMLQGKVDPVCAALKDMKKVAGFGGPFRISMEDAIDLQNLEAQLPPDGSKKSIIECFDLPAGDLDYLKARAAPTRAGFEAALAKNPGHRLTRRALATMDADDGKWPAARKSFEALLAENGADAETRHRFAFAAYYQGDVDLAMEQWGAALAEDPGCPEAWYGVGVLWLGRGLFESAEFALTKALEFDLLNWRAREAVIQAMVGQRKFADAKKERALLRERAPQFPKIGDQIKVAVLPRANGASVTREALLPSVPWLYRIELFDQARPGGKPIKIMELRRDGEAFAWGEVAESGDFRAVKPLTALPELERVLEEAK